MATSNVMFGGSLPGGAPPNLMDMFSQFSTTGSMPSDMFNFSSGTPGGLPDMSNNVRMAGEASSSAPVPVPGIPGSTPPGVVPPAGGPGGLPLSYLNNYSNVGPTPFGGQTGYPVGSKIDLGGNNTAVPTLDPQYTSQLYTWLQSQLGSGATPFNLSAILPTGGTTSPGSLSAPLTNLNSMLSNFYSTGTGAPTGSGLQTLQSEANGGQAFNVSPEWQAMIQQQQQNIQQNEANLKEQYASVGGLGGSEFGTGLSNYLTQTTADQNSLLAQLTNTSYENAQNRQMSAAGQLASGATGMGSYLQGLDQNAINALQAEFIRTRPEYSPLLNEMFAGATTFPSVIGKNVGVGALGAGLSGAGTALTGIADLYGAINPPNN